MPHLDRKPPIEGKTGPCNECGRQSPMRFRLECGPLPSVGITEAEDVEYYFCRWHWGWWHRHGNK